MSRRRLASKSALAYSADMNIYQATSTLLTKAGFYAVRPDGKCFVLSRTAYALRADRARVDYFKFRAADLLADDWDVQPIPTAEAPTGETSNAA